METVTLDIRGTLLKNLPLSDVNLWNIGKDWFLPKCIKYEVEKQKKLQPNSDEFVIPIGEDYECVLSIIESIRHGNTVIILNRQKIDLLIALADKWYCPEELISKYMKERESMKNKFRCIENFINPTQCKNCKIGYDVNSPRVPNECKFHTGTYLSVNSYVWSCCVKN